MNDRIISAYVHFPFCVRKCPYCDFVSYAERMDQKDAYIEALCNEIRFTYSEEMEVEPSSLSTIYLGGGTPSLFSRAQLETVLTCLKETFGIRSDAEITLEVNPGTVQASDFAGFLEIGINRISIGVQSFSPMLLGMLGRIHTSQQARDTIIHAKNAGFTNISCDLMTGLPGQTVQNALDSLAVLIEYRVPHISFYALTLEEGTPFFDRYHKHEEMLPDPDLERIMYHRMIAVLRDNGYDHYEISNSSKPGFESRHNYTYWNALPYYGFGCGAFAYRGAKRTGNTPDLDLYIMEMRSPAARLSSIISETVEISISESQKECMLLGFRLLRGVSSEAFLDRFGVSMEDVFGKELEELLHRNRILHEDGRYRLSPVGLDYANEVFRALV